MLFLKEHKVSEDIIHSWRKDSYTNRQKKEHLKQNLGFAHIHIY